jgi:hypothetical protein
MRLIGDLSLTDYLLHEFKVKALEDNRVKANKEQSSAQILYVNYWEIKAVAYPV